MALFLDTFTGTGTLATHTSDSGHTYSNISGTYDAADMKLDGAGGLYGSSGAYGGAEAVPPILIPEQYTLTIVANIGACGVSDYVFLALSMANYSSTGLQVRNSSGATQVYFSLGADAGGWWQTITPGVHTFVISRGSRDDGKMDISVDGVEDWAYLDTQTAPTEPFDYYLEITGGVQFKVLSLEIAVAPPPASAFWTANTKTTEVFS